MITFQDVDGVRIACWMDERGLVKGRRNLVFVHGSGCDHTLWMSQYDALKDDYNCVGIDLPGHGQSEGDGEADVGRYVEWVRKITAVMGIKKPVVIGHSLGAAISLAWAITHGDELSGIVPVGGGVKMSVNAAILDGIREDTASTLALVAKFSVTKNNRKAMVPGLVAGMLKVNPAVIYGDFLSCDRLDLTDTVSAIAVPTLLICGSDDKMTPPRLSQFMHDRIEGAELVLVPEAGHFVMQENSTDFNRVLKDFLAGSDA